jgi:hypothetical protein
MLPTVPTPLIATSVPSTKAWLFMLSLLATLLVAHHQLKPAAALAGRSAAPAPRRTLLSQPAPRVVFAASASL